MTSLASPISTGKPMPHNQTTRPRVWRSLLWILFTMLAGIAIYLTMLYPWLSRWGATEEEVQMTLPGDALVPQPATITTKGITINAPPAAVWPWLAQLGVDRGGMYSYLWVENWLMQLNVENSEAINSAWQSPQVGDFIRFTPVDYALNPGPGLSIMAIEPNYSLVGCFGLENQSPDCSKSSTWQFVLNEQFDGSTRLLLRSRTAGDPTWLSTTATKLAYAFQFYMERKMLLTMQELAEAHPSAP